MAAGRLSQESVAAMAGVTPGVIARLLRDGPGQPVQTIRADLARRLLEIRSPKARP
jgi:transcriptional regulator with XRE-family HTH domain